MIRTRLAVGVLGGVLASGGVASAQVTPDRMVQGRAARTVTTQFTGRIEHETNVARTSRTLAALQGIRPEDTIVTPTLNFDAVMPVGRQALFARGFASYLFHDRNKRLDHSQFDLTAGVGNTLGPCGSVATAGFAQGRSETLDQVLATNVTNILTTKRVSVGLTCMRPPGLGVFANASMEWGDNSLELAANGDYERRSLSGGLQLGRPSVGSVAVTGNYEKTEYPDRPLLLGGPGGYESIGGGVRLERRLGGRIQASATVQYTHTESQNTAPVTATIGASSNFNGLTYSADLGFKVSSRLQTGVQFNRSVSPTIIAGGAYQVLTSYGATGTYRLGTRFAVTLRASEQEIDVHGDVPVSTGAITDSRSRSGEASLTYRQSRRLAIMLTGSRETRNSDNPLFDFTDNRVGVSTQVSF